MDGSLGRTNEFISTVHVAVQTPLWISNWDHAEMAERRMLRIVLFTAESYISASAEQREIKVAGKQRLQIYTMRPAAPNQPLRQQRSRRGSVRTASVRVKWEAHSGDGCVCVFGKEERGERKKMQYWRLVKSELVRLDRSSVFYPSHFNNLPWFKEAVHLRWGLNCLKHRIQLHLLHSLCGFFFISLFVYDLHHRRGMNIQDHDHREIIKSSYQSYICCGERSKRAAMIKGALEQFSIALQ